MTKTNETKVVKVTKKDKFNLIIEVLNSSNHTDKDMLIEAMEHEIELLDRKRTSGKTSKTAKQNEEYKPIILEVLAKINKPVTVTEVMQADERMRNYNNEPVSNQKLSRLLNDMVNEENPRVIKTIEKKKSYFAIAK